MRHTKKVTGMKTNIWIHVLSWLTIITSSNGLVQQNPTSESSLTIKESISRRSLFGVALSGLAISSFTDNANAFDNKISNKYDDRPKQRGSKPKNLGVLPRTNMVGEEYLGLKHCGGAPNCFCSTDDIEEDPDHSIPAWIWPEEFGNDKQKAFAQLAEVINAYEPGQSNVDGGGFKIFENDAKKGYIYTQFESLKNGYIDDLELAYIDGKGERAVQVRSSSRIGYLDYGVNAKRLNFIAKNLRAKGWDAKGVDFKTHRNYAILNEIE